MEANLTRIVPMKELWPVSFSTLMIKDGELNEMVGKNQKKGRTSCQHYNNKVNLLVKCIEFFKERSSFQRAEEVCFFKGKGTITAIGITSFKFGKNASLS